MSHKSLPPAKRLASAGRKDPSDGSDDGATRPWSVKTIDSTDHLNQGVLVNKGASDYIVYTYDAGGRKLAQQVFGSTPKITDYMGEFIYEGNVLQFVNTEEGRIVMTGANSEYQYHLKDHLGNGADNVHYRGHAEQNTFEIFWSLDSFLHFICN